MNLKRKLAACFPILLWASTLDATPDGHRMRSSDEAICALVGKHYDSIVSGWGLGVNLTDSPDQPQLKASGHLLNGRAAEQMDLDFYNDGYVDRLYFAGYEDHYMQGSALLVQRGHSKTGLSISGGEPIDDRESWFIPCQLDSAKIPLSKCPPFRQDFDEAGFLVLTESTGPDGAWFRARYTFIMPYRLHGTTYLIAKSMAEKTNNFVAVLEPLPTRTFRSVCFFAH
jgi:hypothetical protein